MNKDHEEHYCQTPGRSDPPANGVCRGHSGIEARLERVEADNVDQWATINALRNRLPVWATVAISLLTFLCGILSTMAVKGLGK